MDITKHQIKNGSTQDLLAFRNEIAKYLAIKKYSTKSITLLTTMKKINIELAKRECLRKQKVLSKRLYVDEDKEPSKVVKVPDFLQDNLLRIKRMKSDDNAFISNFNNSFGFKPTTLDTDANIMSAFYIKRDESDETDNSSCKSSFGSSSQEFNESGVDLFFC